MKIFRSLKFWLALSLSLNLLFIGMGLGAASRAHRHSGPEGMRPPSNEVTAILRALPKGEREELMRDFREIARPPKPQNIDELADLIAAEPFDASAVGAYFNANRARNDERIGAAQDRLLASLQSMSLTERQSLAENLRHMPRREGERHKKRDQKKHQN